MKRLALITGLAVLAIAAPSHGHATQKVTAKEAWLVLKQAVTEDHADGTGAIIHLDSCVRQARGRRVQCRATYGFGLADDGRRVCEASPRVTQDRNQYHVTPRNYECTFRSDGREPCYDTPDCPGPGQVVYYGGFSLTTHGPVSAWLYGRRSDDPPGWPLVVADEDGVAETDIRVTAPFIDLGLRHGRPQIAYSHCGEGGDCDLWRYDPSAGREFELQEASSDSCREVTPAVWDDTVVFYREPIPTRNAPPCRAGIYQQTGDRRPELLRRIDPDRRRRVNRTEMEDVDVRGDTIAFVLYRDERSEHEVWLRPSAGASFERVTAQRVYRPGQQPIHETDIAGDYVYWTTGSEADRGEDRESLMFRSRLGGGSTERPADPFMFFTAAFDDDHVLFTAPKGTFRRDTPAEWEPTSR